MTLRVRPRAGGAPLRGVVLRRPRGRAATPSAALEQEGAAPDVARLCDEAETEMSFALAGTDGARGAALRAYLRARGVAGGCLAIVGWEGDAVARPRAARGDARRPAPPRRRRASARRPGRAWERGRFHGPYLRDALLEHGVLVETLETATTWSGRRPASTARSRRRSGAHAPVVGCHVSHLYPTGASLYFTFLARRDDGDPIGQWRAAKAAATDAIVAAGGTITHHHAVGRDHAPWIDARARRHAASRALRAVKRELDPAGIMNPGKLGL